MAKTRRTNKKRTASKKKPSREGHTPGFGMWADRHELGSPEQALDRFRALTRRRRV